MSLSEDFVKKKLKEMKEKFPEMDMSQIEKELYPLDDKTKLKVSKKKN